MHINYEYKNGQQSMSDPYTGIHRSDTGTVYHCWIYTAEGSVWREFATLQRILPGGPKTA